MNANQNSRADLAFKPGTHDPIPPFPVRILRWRDRWIWDTGNVAALALAPMVVSFVLTVLLLPFFGKRALLCLLVWGAGLGFAAMNGLVGMRIRRLKAARARLAAEVAEAQIVRRPFEAPGLAILHQDKLELVPIVGPTITVALADIRTVSEIRVLNGKRLWWKRGFGLELAGGQCISFAVPEPFAREWRARLSRGVLLPL